MGSLSSERRKVEARSGQILNIKMDVEREKESRMTPRLVEKVEERCDHVL